MTPLTTPPGGRGARSTLLWPESACSVSASRGAIKPREGPAGLGGGAPPSSLQAGARDWGSFKAGGSS